MQNYINNLRMRLSMGTPVAKHVFSVLTHFLAHSKLATYPDEIMAGSVISSPHRGHTSVVSLLSTSDATPGSTGGFGLFTRISFLNNSGRWLIICKILIITRKLGNNLSKNMVDVLSTASLVIANILGKLVLLRRRSERVKVFFLLAIPSSGSWYRWYLICVMKWIISVSFEWRKYFNLKQKFITLIVFCSLG